MQVTKYRRLTNIFLLSLLFVSINHCHKSSDKLMHKHSSKDLKAHHESHHLEAKKEQVNSHHQSVKAETISN